MADLPLSGLMFVFLVSYSEWVVLICISLLAKDVEHFTKYLLALFLRTVWPIY